MVIRWLSEPRVAVLGRQRRLSAGLLGSGVVDEAGPRPVTERGDVEFGARDVPPDLEHVHQADVVEDDDRGPGEAGLLEALEEHAFLMPVLRRVGEDQVGVAKRLAMSGEAALRGDVRDHLLQAPVGEVV